MKPGTQLSGRTGTADCQQGIAGAPESEGNYRMRKMQRARGLSVTTAPLPFAPYSLRGKLRAQISV